MFSHWRKWRNPGIEQIGKGKCKRTVAAAAATATAAKSLQLCPTLCNPMDGSLPDSSVHEIFQARVLEWVAIAFSFRFLSVIIFSDARGT